MPPLVVGSQTIEVEAEGAARGAPVVQGAIGWSAGGRSGGWIRSEAPTFRFRADDLTPTQFATLVVDTPPGRLVTCSGDLIGGPGQYLVDRSAEVRWDTDADEARYDVSLALTKDGG